MGSKAGPKAGPKAGTKQHEQTAPPRAADVAAERRELALTRMAASYADGYAGVEIEELLERRADWPIGDPEVAALSRALTLCAARRACGRSSTEGVAAQLGEEAYGESITNTARELGARARTAANTARDARGVYEVLRREAVELRSRFEWSDELVETLALETLAKAAATCAQNAWEQWAFADWKRQVLERAQALQRAANEAFVRAQEAEQDAALRPGAALGAGAVDDQLDQPEEPPLAKGA